MRLKVAILLGLATVALAFTLGAEARSFVNEPIDPRRFDEFGKVGHCDLTARLDNFAIALLQDPQTVGHIVAYGPEGEGPGAGKFTLKLLKEYLIEARGLPKRRIRTIHAGRNQVLYEPKIQLWITRQDVTLPDPPRFETNIETFKGLFFENDTHDFIDILSEAEVMGPGLGLATDAALADMLRQQKKAIAYIVTYNGEDAVPGSAQRIAATRLEALKRHDVDLSRVKTIFGGVRKKSMSQLWITTPGDPPPVKDAGPEPLPVKNAHITYQVDYILSMPENERAVFNRMLEVLRGQPLVKVVAIVKLEAPQETPSEVEEDDPPLDLPKLVQKWREELINTHKVRHDRFIVLFTMTDPESAGNAITLWAVPPGQPLPGPDDEPEEEPSDVVKDPERRP